VEAERGLIQVLEGCGGRIFLVREAQPPEVFLEILDRR
jgi:hypothetical protein